MTQLWRGKTLTDRGRVQGDGDDETEERNNGEERTGQTSLEQW
jgi:hypothetical protein